MHRITGVFDSKSLALNLNLSAQNKVAKDLYYKISKYINDNMFIRFRKEALGYKKITICSIGDHLDPKTDTQDIISAELFLNIEISNKISVNMEQHLDAASTWAVVVQLVDTKLNKVIENIAFLINKSDEMIIRPEIFKS